MDIHVKIFTFRAFNHIFTIIKVGKAPKKLGLSSFKHKHAQTSVRVLGLLFFPDTNIFIMCTNSHAGIGIILPFVEYHIAHHELAIHPIQPRSIDIMFPI